MPNAIDKSLGSVSTRRCIGKLVPAKRLRGGSVYTVLSFRGEHGHAVNDNSRSGCGEVGCSRLKVNVDDAELDWELPGDSLR